MKVLIVDDDYQTQNELAKLLMEANFEVHLCDDGEQAVKMIKEVKPDYIVSDLNMPIMDGFQLATKLKDTGSKIPLIIYTSNENTKLETIALRLGATKFISSRNLNDIFTSVMERLDNAFRANDVTIGKLKTP